MKRRPWIWISLSTLFVIVLCLGAYLSTQVGDADWWRREAEAYNRRHPVADADNAAPLYFALAVPRADRRFPRGDWSLPMAESELALLTGTEDCLAALREASLKPACFYPLNPGTGPFEYVLPHLTRIQQAGNLLVLVARRKAGEGHREEAVEPLLTDLRMAYQQEPGFLISSLVAVAVRGPAWKGVERLAMDAPPEPEALERLEREIGALSAKRPTSREVWEEERLTGLGCLELYYRPAGGLSKLTGGATGPGIPEAALWLGETFTHPLERTRSDMNAFYRDVAKESLSPAEAKTLEKRAETGGMFARMLIPALGKAAASFRRDLACERGTRILLRLRAHRLRKGSYPETLDELGNDLPLDPYPNKPFVYRRRSDDTFLLYSVGEDGKDNGGVLDGRDGFFPPTGKDLIFGRPPTP